MLLGFFTQKGAVMKDESKDKVIFTSGSLGDTASSDVLVIHCSAPEYQAHFQDFCEEYLAGKSFSGIAVPGGPQFLVAASLFPKFEWAGRRWTRFLVEKKNIKEIVCIMHEDCSWYHGAIFEKISADIMKQRQTEDLKKIRATLKDALKGVAVRLVYASPSFGGCVEFCEIG